MQQAEDKTERWQEAPPTAKTLLWDEMVQIHLLRIHSPAVYESPRTRGNRCCSTACQRRNCVKLTCGRARGNIYFQKPWNLGSRQDPISPAVWCGNCTVMAFYVAVLRWLIIYTLHTPSTCYSTLGKLMACSKTWWEIVALKEQILKLRVEK